MTIPARLAAALLALVPFAPAAAQPADDFRSIPFVVTELRGEPASPDITQTVTFEETGSVTGNTGCNSFSAAYIVMSEAIMVQPARTTRMACAPAAMEAEQRLLDALSVVASVDFDSEAGTLVLKGVDRRVVMRLQREDG